MNPNQEPNAGGPGNTQTPPQLPPQPATTTDIPEEGFGFADEQPQPNTQPAAPVQPVVATQPQLIATPPTAPQPAVAPPTADIMPPQRIPAVPVPTMPPPQPAPVTPPVQPPPLAPTAAPSTPIPAPQPPHPTPTASAASYTPQSVTHLPQDLAERINEKPMQNSGDVLRQVKHGLEGSRLKSILSFIVFTASIFVAAFLINQFIFQSYYVEGTSMTPTLQNNDRLIISKVERSWSAIQGKPYIPERGQVVVLDSSIVGLNGQHEQLIKRVIGVPGDRVHIEAGTVTITNSEHPDGYDVTSALGLTNLQATYAENVIDVGIPDGHVYVMGDNREQGGSYDSRAFGPIEGNKIQGRLWGRILPLDKAQLY